MKRQVLVIPFEEVEQQFCVNGRFDLKLIAPDWLMNEKSAELRKAGRFAKPECPLNGERWKHAAPDEPNSVCLSQEFSHEVSSASAVGPFAISVANEQRVQDCHLHNTHSEVYVSNFPMQAEYRSVNESEIHFAALDHGGIFVFAPGVIHHVTLAGLTTIIEVPAVCGDKQVMTL